MSTKGTIHGRAVELRPGTLMVEVATEGARKEHCMICTGPKNDAHGAFLVGFIEGVLSVLTKRPGMPGPRYPNAPANRFPLCVDHENALRSHLSNFTQDPDVFEKLGIVVKIASAGEG